MSLSARRAWIEMLHLGLLIKEGTKSLSARRAWIEIAERMTPDELRQLSLSARRAWIEMSKYSAFGCMMVCRSPQGERG